MVAGAGLAAYGAARAITAPRRELAEQNLQFMGLNQGTINAGQLGDLRRSGRAQGFNAQQQMAAANLLQRNVGDVGGNAQLLTQFAGLRRTTGLGAEDIAGITGGFRAAATDREGAGLQQNLDKTQKLFRQAMISALDASGTVKFMQKISEMTTSMAEEGTADVGAIADTLTQLSLSSGFFAANTGRGMTALKGGENFFRSAAGTGLAMRALRNIGGVGEGQDRVDFTKMSAPELLLQQQRGFTREGGLGEKGLRAITKELTFAATGIDSSAAFKTATPAEKATAALTVQQQLGFNDPKLAEELLDATFKGKELTKEQKESFAKATETERQKLSNISNSMDLNMRQNDANFHELIQVVGEKVAGPLVSMEGHVIRIAEKIAGVSPGAKSVGELRIDRQDLERQRREEGGSVTDRLKGIFGMDVDTKIRENQRQSSAARLREGRGFQDFNESNRFVESATGPYSQLPHD